MADLKTDQPAVVITGTSSGIGHATALLLDRKGYRVFAGVRKEAQAEQLRGEGSPRLVPLILDITCQEQIVAAAARVTAELGPDRGLWALVNNAGSCEPGPIEFIDMDRFRRQMEVNLFGHVAMIQAFMPLVRKGPGRVINVASATGRFALPMLGAYVASKSAMEGMSDALRRELRFWRIPVSIIEPGTVDAPIYDKTPNLPPRRPNGELEDRAGLYDFLGKAMTGLLNRGRSVAVMPEVLAEVIVKAVEDRRPRARYRRGPGSWMAVMGSRLPEWFTDWVVERIVRKDLPSQLMGW